MRLKIQKLLVFAALISSASISEAHHGIIGDVDLATYVDLVGMIESVEWANAHVVVHLNVTDENGYSQLWHIQADSPNTLLRKGINRGTFEYMTAVQFRVYPAISIPCSNECLGYGYEYTASNGSTYNLHQGIFEFVHQLTAQPN